jgi:hypothetical protein
MKKRKERKLLRLRIENRERERERALEQQSYFGVIKPGNNFEGKMCAS